MSQDLRGRTAPGPVDSGLVERAEALLDEAVGQAAKGSYGQAADKAQQALAIDPDNAVARDLLESYRRQVADDDERRKRRRSIAAAAATIEEMVESERLEEAAAATEALEMQFGPDAPVEELRRRIGEARAVQLDLHDLDAAFKAIRLPTEGGPQPTARANAGNDVVAQIEEHLRSNRIDEASRLLTRLESEPGSEDRARKLQTRIEEAQHVAAEHRREEEILIATAAIEERLRLGNIDDATQRLADLAERHGSSAPVAELRERLTEARALAQERGELASAVEGAVDSPTADRGHLAAPMWGSMVEEELRGGGRARWVAIAVMVAIALAVLGWWWAQRPSTRTGQPITDDPTRAVEGTGATAPEAAEVAASPDQDVAAASDEAADGARGRATGGNVAVDPRSALTNAAPAADRSTAALAPPIDPAAAGGNGVSPPVTIEQGDAAVSGAAGDDAALVDDAPDAPAEAPSSASFETETPAGATDGGAQVVVEAVSASEAPAPPPLEPAVNSSSAADAAAAPADPPAPAPAPADGAPAGAEEDVSAPPPAAPQQLAAADRARDAAPPPAAAPASVGSGPAVLGCGAPGVVCLKALQVPTPRYPAAARARRLDANVVVMALVDERGRVIQTRLDSSSFAFFNEAATDAARGATFQPATRQGVPGRSWARLTFKFQP